MLRPALPPPALGDRRGLFALRKRVLAQHVLGCHRVTPPTRLERSCIPGLPPSMGLCSVRCSITCLQSEVARLLHFLHQMPASLQPGVGSHMLPCKNRYCKELAREITAFVF